jgi:DNA-binding MarR family transcriptional regulator
MGIPTPPAQPSEGADPAIGAADGAVDAGGAAPAARVLRQFRLVFNAVKGHFQQVERRTGIGGAQLWALSLVHERPGLGVGELARAMDIHQSTASNLVKALAAKGLVAAAKDDGDRRAVRLQLQPAGAVLLAQAPGPFSGVLPQALATLDEPTLQRLSHDLEAVIAALGVDRRGANIPLGQ